MCIRDRAYTSQSSGTYVLKTFVNHLDAAITDPYIYNNAGCTPLDAVLVWQDEENLVTNVRLSSDKHSLTFDVPQATIKQGNACLLYTSGRSFGHAVSRRSVGNSAQYPCLGNSGR